jgi:DMSO/TMAO reductase YedYZ heme-binding membrane subunit
VNGFLWYSARAGGEVALLFLTMVVVLGVMSALRAGGRQVPRFVLAAMHRNLTLIGLGFLAVHIASTVLDSYAPIGLTDVVVPFAAAYRPFWLGLGALAFDVLAVLTVTSLLRTRIGLRWWRALHWAAYACWTLALVHALGTGTDTRVSIVLFLTGVCGAVVLVAVAWRITAAGPVPGGGRAGLGLAVLIVAAGIAIWTVRGPLEPGWAKRSGTPAAPASTPTGSVQSPQVGSGE